MDDAHEQYQSCYSQEYLMWVIISLLLLHVLCAEAGLTQARNATAVLFGDKEALRRLSGMPIVSI